MEQPPLDQGVSEPVGAVLLKEGAERAREVPTEQDIGGEKGALCSRCRLPRTRADLSLKSWTLSRIVGYRQKTFGAIGFPSAATVTVEGWKAQRLSTFNTAICNQCAGEARYAYEGKREGEVKLAHKLMWVFGSVAAGLAVVAARLLVFPITPTFGTESIPYTTFAGGAVIFAVLALACYAESRKFHANDGGDFDHRNPEKAVHESIALNEAERHIGQSRRKIIRCLKSEFRDAQVGDILLHSEDLSKLGRYRAGSGWSLIWATSKANSFVSTIPHDCEPESLEASMRNQKFQDAGAFLNAQ
jgi:hypothetical protein